MKKCKLYITYHFVGGRSLRITEVFKQSSDVTAEKMSSIVNSLMNGTYHHQERGKTAKIILLANVTSIDVKYKEL